MKNINLLIVDDKIENIISLTALLNDIENIFFVYGDNDYLSDEIYTIELELKDKVSRKFKNQFFKNIMNNFLHQILRKMKPRLFKS